MDTIVYSLVQSQRATAVVVTEYIISFNLKEQLLLLLQNVNELKQSTPALAASFTMCYLTRQNGLVIQRSMTSKCLVFKPLEARKPNIQIWNPFEIQTF